MADAAGLAAREWLAVSGHGAFAMGNIDGGESRRYHGLLVAALDPPTQRRVLLGALDAQVTIDDQTVSLSTHVYEDGTLHPDGWSRQIAFHAAPTPTWTFALPSGGTITRQVRLAPGENTVHVLWRLDGASHATLTLAPLIADRDYHALQRRWDDAPHDSEPEPDGWRARLVDGGPTLRLRVDGGAWERAHWWNERIRLEHETRRGFDAVQDLYCPAIATVPLRDGQTVAFTATVEEQPALAPAFAAPEPAPAPREMLRRTASAFVVETPRRATILAGYPWFTDWGRDTFIALPGLLLTTGRVDLARRILLDYARFVHDGRIPNRFPDHGGAPEYNNADATLWYVRACRRTLAADPDPQFAAALKTPLDAILRNHLDGTVGDGIGVDADGLLRCGDSRTNLTWMDAKVDGHPVTARDGKPVEINALWIDALAFAAEVLDRPVYAMLSGDALAAFHAQFVRPDGLGLFDRIFPEGSPDHAIRPNQVLAAAVLGERLEWSAARNVFEVASDRLLTPYGLRTLDPADPAFRGRYEGDGRTRDGAYHQGTVWPWLIGAYVDLGRRVHGDAFDAAAAVESLLTHLETGGIGGISEVFDGLPPQRPEGCPWQAWSVAEVLRVL